MSENSELIHRHLRPRLVALLVDAASPGEPNPPTPPPSSHPLASIVRVGPRLAGASEEMQRRVFALFVCWFHVYVSKAFKKSFQVASAKKGVVHVQLTSRKLSKSRFVQNPVSSCFSSGNMVLRPVSKRPLTRPEASPYLSVPV